MYPQFLTLILFGIATSFTPGPNNIMASHSGFNFGFKKTAPLMLGVIFGWTAMLISMEAGLIFIFLKFEILQLIIKILGSFFLIYLAYKIAFSKNIKENKKENPVKFIETFFFQFLNPKGVIVAIIIVSTYVESGSNFINYSFWVILVSFLCAFISITFWTFVGKFFRRFATNEKFIKVFNYVMSSFLLACIVTFYL